MHRAETFSSDSSSVYFPAHVRHSEHRRTTRGQSLRLRPPMKTADHWFHLHEQRGGLRTLQSKPVRHTSMRSFFFRETEAWGAWKNMKFASALWKFERTRTLRIKQRAPTHLPHRGGFHAGSRENVQQGRRRLSRVGPKTRGPWRKPVKRTIRDR